VIVQDEKLTSSATEKTPEPSLRVAELDGLRALAILLVVSFHSWYFLQFVMPTTEAFLAFSDSLPWVLGFIRRGDLGVDIFFVLSGYLLSWQLFPKRMKTGQVNLKSFYARRLFRIYPLYVVALMLAALDSGITLKMLGNLLAYNIWTDASNIIIPWTWSLSVELEFYAIVPLLILLVRNGTTLGLLSTAFAVLTVGWSYWVLTAHPQLAIHSLIDLKLAGQNDDIALFYKYLYVAMPVRLSQFTFGMAGAWVVLNRASFLSKIGGATKVLLVLLILIGIALPLVHNPFTNLTDTYRPIVYFELLFGRVAFASAIAMMIVLLHSNSMPRLKGLLSVRFLEPIARFSFSMYLFHPLFIYLGIVTFIGKGKTETVSVFQYVGVCSVAILGSMLFGYITWHVIERPAIRFGRKKFG
jgi:peptidoglycan/LPS O-acetylase OafA/YrhL